MTRKTGEFNEKEKVYVMATRKGEELHFSIVEVEGKTKVDIRFFSRNEEGLWPTYRGIVLDTAKIKGLLEGTEKLLVATKQTEN